MPSFKPTLLFTMFVMICAVLSASQSDAAGNPVVEAAINAFQQGKLDESREKFLTIVNEPHWSFTALYNLGDIAARQKKYGEALAYFKRAQTKKPHDPDTLSNIRVVTENLGARRFGGTPSNYEFFRSQVLTRFAFGEFLAITLLATFLFLTSLIQYLKTRAAAKLDDPNATTPPSAMNLISAVVFLALVSVTILKLIDTYSERGTVIASKTDLRSGPSESNASMTEVPEGAELLVLDRSQDTAGGWLQVAPSSGSGLTGWIPAQALMLTSGGGPW